MQGGESKYLTSLFSSPYNKEMSKKDEIANELKQMKAQMERTVDINYEKYNNVFMEKVAEHNRELKKEKSRGTDQHIDERVRESLTYLHDR